MPAEDILVDMKLGIYGFLDGELGGRLFVELFAHLAAELVIIAQGSQMFTQGFPVSRLKQVAVDVGVDQEGDTAHGGGHGGQMEPGTLGQGVGEGLTEAGEGVDVQSGVKAVHAAADPPGKGHLLFHTQFFHKSAQFFPLLAVAGDNETEPLAFLIASGEAPHQGGHILDGIQPGGDAHHHGILVHIRPQVPQVGKTVALRRRGGKVDAIVDGVEPVRRKAPGDEQVHHGVRYTDAVVQVPQGPGVDGTEGQAAEGAAHVVQLIVAVDSRDHRQTRGGAQQGAHHVGPGAVAVDELVAACPDVGSELPPQPGNVVAAHNFGRNAHLPGLLGEGAVPEADQLGGDDLVQILQQAQDVCFGTARVAAADEMDDFHRKKTSFQKMVLWILKK